jgi:hypothetical protein
MRASNRIFISVHNIHAIKVGIIIIFKHEPNKLVLGGGIKVAHLLKFTYAAVALLTSHMFMDNVFFPLERVNLDGLKLIPVLHIHSGYLRCT